MDSARQVGVGGGGAGQAGVDCDGAEPAGVKEPPRAANPKTARSRRLSPQSHSSSSRSSSSEKTSGAPRPQLRARPTRRAGGGSGLPVDRTAGQRGPQAALGEGRLRQSRGVGRARPVRGIDKDQRQALGGSRGRPQESPHKGAAWIKASSRIRATPRPMKIVVECASREEQDAEEWDAAPVSPRAGPPADEAVFQSAGTAGSHLMQHSREGRLPCI